MARPSITGDSDLVEDQIQREAENHENRSPSSEKKKRRRSRQGKRSEERHRLTSLDNVNPGDLDHNHGDEMVDIAEKESLGSSPFKKRKKTKHRDQSKLYDVPGVENLPAKRKTSYKIAQDLAIEANEAPVKPKKINSIFSYLGTSPSVNTPEALVPHVPAENTLLKSSSAQQARLDTILKSCSRKTIANKTFDDMAQDNGFHGSPCPPVGLQHATVKVEHEVSTVSFREILRACNSKEGRFSCPVEGCTKSYTRKDSLAGHMPKSHSDQIFRDNGNRTYSVVAQPEETTEMGRSLQSAQREIQKYTNSGGKNSEAKRDRLARKTEEKGEVVMARQKPTTQRSSIGLSVTAESLPPAKSVRRGRDAEVERDSGAFPIVVRSSMPPRTPKPSKPAVGNITTAEVPYGLAMEEWEVSPGTIRTVNVSSGGHEVAYSAHHIRNNPTVTEFANTSFAIHTILGGRSFGFPLETFVRVCYVVSGKLQVHVDGADFAIGKGGMWRVTGLGSCVVGNRGYEDGVIHVTSIRID